ncbi:MAG TPA: PD-(D/E)XK nuclease family protein [Candidatus Nitrosotenuis sp.]|nr:PD-(D/E)XK nuclease family protein [Candidatus Nitrosotenuis sp.]
MTVYSHSRLATFENCALRYKFRYIDKLEKPGVQSIEAYVGTRVHAILQKLYEDLIIDKLNPLESLVEEYRAEWKKCWTPGIHIVRSDRKEEDYRAFGEKCIRNYYAQYYPFKQSRTLKTECSVPFALDPAGKYKLRGVIDRIARRDDGTFEVHDYKTKQSLPSQAQADADRQLGLYQLALPALWPDAQRIELFWHFPAFRTTIKTTRTANQLVQLKENTMALMDRIEAAREFPPHKSGLCAWCEYRAECPEWAHAEAVEKLAPEEFKQDAGVQLVDEFARLRSQAAELEIRLQTVRQKLIEFAEQKNVRTIRGSQQSVSVTHRSRILFPGKNDPERPALDEFLRAAKRWHEVSIADTHELARIVKDKCWPAKQLEQLAQFATTEVTTEVRLLRGQEDAAETASD